MDQYIGRLLDGRYEILEIIGTGGMAVVYKARCHRLNRLVAIKILKDEFSRDEEFRRRFRAEGEAVAMLSHPNIVQVYDVSTSDSANFIVMELIDGISLKEYMEKKGILNWKETLHFSLQIAKGLEHAHSRGIVHRDIKPHNIMVLKNGSVKVMDFGIARVMNKSNTLTKEALGSVHYISPEQAKGGHTDNRSDLYSLGVVMYEMMAGRPPYDGESAVSVAIQHINGGAPLPSSYNPNIPTGLEQIIMKAMALEMRDRYVSATEMLQDMEEFRKNPAIVFDYHSLLDDATRKIPDVPMTTAEKKVQLRTGERPAPVSQHTGQRRTTAARPATAQRDSEIVTHVQQRHRQEQKKRDSERSRVATTAVVICCAVAVFAIIVFLIALFSGALLDQEKDTVEVPYLTGGLYSAQLLEAHPDFNIRQLPQEYSDSHPKDEIISQEPVGGSKVQRGSAIWITVSMGPKPEVKTLDNFAGADAEEAYKLLESQGFKPLKKKEPSYVYKAGEVTRTEPGADAEVTAGQTIYIYVSTGPEVVMLPMPDVMGLGVERARELLSSVGFTNVRYEKVESTKPAGEIVYQSVEKNVETDASAEVIIHYSAGQEPEETTEDTVPGETEPEETGSFSAVWILPVRDEAYQLDVCLGGTPEVLFSKTIAPGANTVKLDLSGHGTVYYDLYIDGVFECTKDVTFTDD